MAIAIFVLLSAAVCVLYCVTASALTLWKAALVLLAAFLACNLLYILFWIIVSLSVDDTKPIEKQSKLCRAACAEISALACTYSFVRVHITGEEKLPQSSRFLYVCNHRSGYDPLIAMDKLRKYNISFISKPSNMKLPFLGKLSYGAGFLPIDRENDRNALRTIITAVNYLKKNICSMGVFPEGTRSKDGTLGEFHAGSFKTAQRASVPVVVASVCGSENIIKNLLRPTDVYLDILEVIPAERVSAANTTELSDYCRGLIENNLSKRENGK